MYKRQVSDGGSAAYLSKELSELGLTALPYQVDLDDPADMDQLLADVAEDLGPLDVLVNLVPAEPEEIAATTAGRLRSTLLELLASACKGGRLVLLSGPAARPYGGPSDTEVDTVPLPMPLPNGWTDPAIPPSVHHATAMAVLLLLGIPATGGDISGDSDTEP